MLDNITREEKRELQGHLALSGNIKNLRTGTFLGAISYMYQEILGQAHIHTPRIWSYDLAQTIESQNY